MTTLFLAAAAPSKEPAVTYATEKIVALFITLALIIIACGFFLPFGARRRANNLERQIARETDPQKKQQLQARRNRALEQDRQSPLAVLIGADGRLSTSKTVAAVWTALIAFVLIALILVGAPNWDTALSNLNWTYFAMLGGPYAALVLAKVAVTARTQSGSLQKTQAPGDARLSDLVADDTGKPDLFDIQYVMFNLIAIGFVAVAFWHATESGFPSIPQQLVLLTAGPAAVYLGNKAAASNASSILSVVPSAAHFGDTITIYGQNFLPDNSTQTTSGTQSATPAPGADAASSLLPSRTADSRIPLSNDRMVPLTVDIGGVAIEPSTTPTNSSIQAEIPSGGLPLGIPLRVTVITSAGLPAALDNALTITGPPRLLGADKQSVRSGDQLTLYGEWAVNRGIVVTVDGVVVPNATPPTSGTVTVTFPQLAQPLPRDVEVMLSVGGEPSSTLTVQAT